MVMVESANDSAVLHRSVHQKPLKVIGSDGLYLHLENGQHILDATGGAAVACLGHNHPRIKAAMIKQMDVVSYGYSLFHTTDAAEDLCRSLVEGTNGHMKRAYIVSSGSEAIEAAMKMARQYFIEMEGKATKRRKFIARRQSYHGTTLGCLNLGGHVARRDIYEPMLSAEVSHVSPCYAYRGMRTGESEEDFVARLAEELDQEFQSLGPDTVCAFFAEPIVGAALGCVPAVKGYFKAIRAVCDKYGALLVFDEVMSGMGRSGYLHAWQSPIVGVAPDLQTIGKGLGAGYAPVAAMLVGTKVEQVLSRGTGVFAHGQTYQAHPLASATAAAVQRVFKEDGLIEQSRRLGLLLEKELKEALSDMWYVGDIRGMGLFWGIEFVQDKQTKAPFDPKLQVAAQIHNLGMQEPYSICIHPSTGTADGWKGDHVLLAPAYTATEEEINIIVRKTAAVIKMVFGRNPALAKPSPVVIKTPVVQVSEIMHEINDPQDGTLTVA